MRKLFSPMVWGWVLLIAAAIVSLTVTTPATAQEVGMKVLTVTGQGQEFIQTTKTHVDLGVEVRGQAANEVQQDIAQRSTAVIELLRDRKVEKLQTTGIRLNPQYNYDRGEGRITGYVGVNTVSFEMPTEQVGTLLDEAIEAGATQIQGVSFIASDEAMAAARKVALQAATAEAQSQAEVVLGGLGMSVEEIIGIQIDGASGPIEIPVAQQSRLAESSVAYDTPVIGGEQTVRATVTLQIRY